MTPQFYGSFLIQKIEGFLILNVRQDLEYIYIFFFFAVCQTMEIFKNLTFFFPTISH